MIGRIDMKERALNIIKNKGSCFTDKMNPCFKCTMIECCTIAMADTTSRLTYTQHKYRIFLDMYIKTYGTDDDLLEVLI